MPRKSNAAGVYSASGITLSDGDEADLQFDSSGNVKVNVVAGGSGGSGTSANLYTGQATVNTTAVQLSASSHSLTNGIIVKAPSTNGAKIYVGLVGVTTSTGDILEPGDSRGYPVNNTNLLYIISVASTTDVVSYEGN